MTDRMEKIIAAGEADHAAVRLQERAKIVAWLRGQWNGRLQSPVFLADAIESGEHLKENDNV
jgi:hypothetical protein